MSQMKQNGESTMRIADKLAQDTWVVGLSSHFRGANGEHS